jgi:PAS domain S-box-containing protein
MREREHLFYSLIQNSSDIITILKEDGTISYESPSLKRVLGYAPEELIGRNAFELIHPDDLQKTRDAFAEVIRTPDGPLSIQFRFRHKDGSWRVLESTGSNQLQNALVAGIVVNSRDVTKRIQVEELLREAIKRAEEEKIKTEAVIAAIGDGISIQDTKYKVLYQNQVHKNIVEGDRAGEYCYLTYAHNDQVCEGCPLTLAFRDGKIHTVEKSALRERGMIHVEIKGSPLKDSAGNIIAGIEVVRDITERKQMEEKLRESEERFRRIFENGPLGMIIADPDFKILKANRALCEMLGYAEADLPGRSIGEITHTEDIEKSASLSKQLLHGDIPFFQLEKRYIKKNGETLWVNLTAAAIRGQNGEVLYALGMVEDISRRKLAEQERERLVHDLQQALDKIKALRGLLPMCAWCKKIRNDKGYWQKVETYIQEHSDASFTHGICPECLNKVDPATAAEVFESDKERKRLKPERRRFERKPYTETGNYRFRLKEAKGQSALHAVIHDISDGGMCIRTDHPLEHSWVVIFSDEAGEKTGIVKWKEKVSVDDNTCRAGIEFLQN